jgi:hypothetical protein
MTVSPIVKAATSHFKEGLSSIMSSRMDWEEITVSVTVRRCAEDVTITSQIDTLKGTKVR